MFTAYHWSLHKRSPLNPEGPWTEVKRLDAKVLTELDGPNFVLAGKLNEREHSLEADTIYKARVVAFIDEEHVKEDQVIFKTNSAPYTYDDGGCSVAPLDGFTLQTTFLVNCSKWYDTDLPLSYTFR